MLSIERDDEGRATSDPAPDIDNKNLFGKTAIGRFNLLSSEVYPSLKNIFASDEFRPHHNRSIGYSFRPSSPLSQGANILVFSIPMPPIEVVCKHFLLF
jgi:hypothetical protein